MLLRDLVDECQAIYLMGTYRPAWNLLADARSTTDTEFRLQLTTPNLSMGSTIQVDDELLRVADATADHRTLTVMRGMAGSPAQSHVAGAYVEVNPRYPRALIRQAMRSTVRSWPDKIYWTDTVSVPMNGSRVLIVDPAHVGGEALGGGDIVGVARILDPDGRRVRRFEYQPLDGLFAIQLTNQWPGYHPGTVPDPNAKPAKYTVTRMRKYVTDPWDDTIDLETDAHIPASLHDALELGAASRLLVGKETIRLAFDVQGDTRRADEVQTTTNLRFSQQLRQMEDQQVEGEADDLTARFGLTEVWSY